MSALKKRAQALENEFVYQQEFMFKATARRNAMLGLWAANTMHRPDGEQYARELAMADVSTPDGAFNRIRSDLIAAGVICPDDELRDRMVAMLKDVARELRGC
ncbi:hypothetical protein QO002_001411 [Pararhizobium capsulatum DSM 1112]|uniref:DUF1476 domain-containing protein n=1 Tax=Pararhizobium capsulatum DSM 1112 TaxID=1121113 RepID=A0ABU0BLZ9_9HYPH|nr:ATPase inhibitor subunit zeta [Pararhizobium capsulatum]MDQ0319273.1 hypothetical protein [Pararhizobium capsulatum DSM 1112]